MEPSSLFDLHIDGEVSGFFKEISRWAKFISVLGLVMCGLISLVSILFILVSPPNTFVILAIVILVFVVACMMPYLRLYQFAAKMQHALRLSDQEALNRSLSKLKSYFKYVGVLTVVLMCFLIVLNFMKFE